MRTHRIIPDRDVSMVHYACSNSRQPVHTGASQARSIQCLAHSSTRLNTIRDANHRQHPLQFQANSLVGVIDDPSAIRPLVAALGRTGIRR